MDCGFCGEKRSPLRCSKCKNTRYCSRICQKLDWDIHRNTCSVESKQVTDKCPTENCPICFENESTDGGYVVCFQCGNSFCGVCMMPENISKVFCCPMCRDNKQRTEEERLKRALELVEKPGKKFPLFPIIGYQYEKLGKHEKSMFYYRESAKLGNHMAFFRIGNFHESHGRVSKAISFYRRSARKRNPFAIRYLADYEMAKGNKENAHHLYEKSCKRGDIGSFFFSGQIYQEKGDYEKAVDFYSKGSINNCCNSRNGLGFLFKNGFPGVKKDIEKAFLLFSSSVDGCPDAYYNLALCYHDGFPISDPVTETYMYICGSSKGSVNCILVMANLFYLCHKKPEVNPFKCIEYFPEIKDYFEESKKMYKKGFDLGSSLCGYKLGEIMIDEMKPPYSEFKEAVEILISSGIAGEKKSFLKLSKVFREGKITKKNILKSFAFQKMADQV
jgi:TPR repeat protein